MYPDHDFRIEGKFLFNELIVKRGNNNRKKYAPDVAAEHIDDFREQVRVNDRIRIIGMHKEKQPHGEKQDEEQVAFHDS